MPLSLHTTVTAPEVAAFIGLLVTLMFLIAASLGGFIEIRKTKIAARQDEDLRQLIRRYEHLAENSLDAQQRVAADVAELRTRSASIEQLLRSVE